MRRGLRLIAAAFVLIARPVAADPLPHVIRIVGYNDMREMLTTIAVRIKAKHPGITLALDLRSTRSAPASLIDGTSALAPMGAAMDPADRAAIRARWGADPVEIRVAHDSLDPAALSSPTGVLVATDNPLRSISLQTVRTLFIGAPMRWSQLGVGGEQGPHLVHLYGLASDTAIGRYLLDGPLAALGFAAGYHPFRQSRDAAAAVAVDPDGIALANLSHAGNTTRALAIIDASGRTHRSDRAGIRSGTYPFDRFLLVYARRTRAGRVEPDARLVLDFMLSREGQRLIGRGRLGYIPLNPRDCASERRKLG